eukprot:4433178-Prymnesium_polylepis.1
MALDGPGLRHRQGNRSSWDHHGWLATSAELLGAGTPVQLGSPGLRPSPTVLKLRDESAPEPLGPLRSRLHGRAAALMRCHMRHRALRSVRRPSKYQKRTDGSRARRSLLVPHHRRFWLRDLRHGAQTSPRRP